MRDPCAPLCEPRRPRPTPRVLFSCSEYYHFRQAWVPLRWMSPEAILEGDFSTKSDVWAFGVLMWEVFTHGEMPHGGQADDEVLAGRVPSTCSSRWRVYSGPWGHPACLPSGLVTAGTQRGPLHIGW